jgi:chorismate mutase
MIRGFRGATALSADHADEMNEAVAELVSAMIERNRIRDEDVISMFLTNTPDLRSAFPAAAVRRAGLTDIPLLCASEIDVAGAMPRVVRILLHAASSLTRAEVQHVYLRGTEALRADLPHTSGQ